MGVSTYFQVPSIPPEVYSRNAVDLSITAKWRYGYVVGFHGAHLVKAYNTQDTPEIVPDFSPESSDDKKLFSVMSQTLKTYPLRAALEALFYSFLVGYFFLVPWLRKKFAVTSSRYSQKILFGGTIWALGWTLACLPLLCFEYGSSLFSTGAGPGAAVYSGPYPDLMTGLSGETISYRLLLEFASVFSIIAVESTGLGGYLPEMTISLLVWISGALFYSMAAFLVCGAACLIDAIDVKRSDRQN